MEFVGENMTPGTPKRELAYLIGLLKFVVIGCVLAGFDPFQRFNLPTPSFFTWLLQNKTYGCLAVFFVSNMVEGQLVATGAFEVYLNDRRIWSKLETGQVPQLEDLLRRIGRTLAELKNVEREVL